MTKYKINYQLAPTHVHRCNSAEQSTRTFKRNVVAFLSTTDHGFSIRKCNLLLNQEFIKLNILRNSWFNPNLSAYAYIFGKYDINGCPMEPQGTRVVINENTYKQNCLGHHLIPHWYIRPSHEHYLNMICYMPATGMEKFTGTLQFFQKPSNF